MSAKEYNKNSGKEARFSGCQKYWNVEAKIPASDDIVN